MSHYKPYPAYKDSGVEWLGQVPEHWGVRQLRSIAVETLDGFVDGDWIEAPFITDEGVRLIQTGNVGVGEYREQGFRYISEATFNDLRCTEFHPGDLLICRLGDPVGRACFAPDLGCRMITSVDNVILKPKPEFARNYFLHLFSSKSYLAFFEAECRGATRDRVSRSMLGAMMIPIPDLSEQQKIGAHLDRETARIDALVAKKTRFIELLREKRQALITHTVTKGLDPNVKMKDSGVEWLGEVPEHWAIKRLQFLCSSIKAGPFGSALTKDMYVSDGYRVYGQEQVIPGDFSIGDYYITPEYFSELAQYAVQPGDVLVSCVGTFGKIAVVPEGVEPGIINPRLIRIRVNQLVSPVYLTMLMRSSVVFEQFSLWSRGGTMDVINIGTLSGIVLSVPPASEQQAIIRYVEHEAGRIDALVNKTERSIELLKERRSALITAAVTGQIDLREAV